MSQTEQLLKLLNERNVRYVVIGAVAFAAHGWTRATHDLDLFVSPDDDNLKRLKAALTEFGYDSEDATIEDFKNFKILFRQYDLALDIHPMVTGVSSFKDVWSRKVVETLGDVEVPFVSLEDLIQMKTSAGRPKDLNDLQVLKKLRDQKK